MREYIYQWVKIIVTSVIVLSVFESLLPKEDIKKTSMFIGKLVFLMSVLLPAIGLFSKDLQGDVWQSYYGYSYEMESDLYNVTETEESRQRRLIENLYYENTVNMIENHVKRIHGINRAKADVIFQTTDDDGLYGSIKKIMVVVSFDKSVSKKPSLHQIEQKVAEYFDVDMEYVYVTTMQEEVYGQEE